MSSGDPASEKSDIKIDPNADFQGGTADPRARMYGDDGCDDGARDHFSNDGCDNGAHGDHFSNDDRARARDRRGWHDRARQRRAAPPELSSYGMALVHRAADGRNKILLVCKRFTYEYYNFVVGRYSPDQARSPAYMRGLLDRMTVDEKFDLLSFNFDQMWYRVFIRGGRAAAKVGARKKFAEFFGSPEGAARLRDGVAASANGTRPWSIPKGRKNDGESDIACAIREFGEETNIDKALYSIAPGVRRTLSFVDSRVRYTLVCFAATTDTEIPVRISWEAHEQTGELCDIRWMTIEEIRAADTSGRLAALVRPLVRALKKSAQ